MSHCAGDYMAGLRPRVSKLDKAKAVATAFAQFGKPYDFDFDFATDDTLVCTELVFRAYQPRADTAGVSLDLREMAGRSTLPANDIAAQYARDVGTSQQQFDFVVFVDASEKERRAFISDERAFLMTPRTPQVGHRSGVVVGANDQGASNSTLSWLGTMRIPGQLMRF